MPRIRNSQVSVGTTGTIRVSATNATRGDPLPITMNPATTLIDILPGSPTEQEVLEHHAARVQEGLDAAARAFNRPADAVVPVPRSGTYTGTSRSNGTITYNIDPTSILIDQRRTVIQQLDQERTRAYGLVAAETPVSLPSAFPLTPPQPDPPPPPGVLQSRIRPGTVTQVEAFDPSGLLTGHRSRPRADGRIGPRLNPVSTRLSSDDMAYLVEIENREVSSPEMAFSTRRFGVEIEYIGITRQRAYEVLIEGGVNCAIEDYNHQRRNHWKLTTDSSIRVTSGMDPQACGELVSPPLTSVEGLRQVMLVCRIMTAAGATVNTSCGLHVHVDGAGLNAQDISQVLMRYSSNQELVNFLMPSGRRNNRYCLPVGEAVGDLDFWLSQLWAEQTPILEVARRWNRYSAVNLASYTRHGTIEFRQHSGSVEPEAVANWIQFCVYFVETSRYRPSPTLVLDAVPVVQAPPAPAPRQPAVVNGIRLNRRIRYDRRRAFFAFLMQASSTRSGVSERDLKHLLRIPVTTIRRMVSELNSIALRGEPPLSNGNLLAPTSGFYISTEGRTSNKIYCLHRLTEIRQGFWTTGNVRASRRPAGDYLPNTVGPADDLTIVALATWFGGRMPHASQWMMVRSDWVGRDVEYAWSDSWNTDWTTRYATEWRRVPRVPPVDDTSIPAPIPRNRRSVFANHPRPSFDSFSGVERLFGSFPESVRAFYFARAHRFHAPWATGRATTGIPTSSISNDTTSTPEPVV